MLTEIQANECYHILLAQLFLKANVAICVKRFSNTLFGLPSSVLSIKSKEIKYAYMYPVLFIIERGWSLVAQTVQFRRPGFNPRVGKIPWRMEWQPTPVFLPENNNRIKETEFSVG